MLAQVIFFLVSFIFPWLAAPRLGRQAPPQGLASWQPRAPVEGNDLSVTKNSLRQFFKVLRVGI